MTVSHWQRDLAAPRIVECDVSIVGAGIAGASVAWWLRRLAPDLRVCVVEKQTIGAGASGRNAGMVLAGLAAHYDEMARGYGRDHAGELWQATLDHRRWLGEFLDESGADVHLDPCGSWRVGYEADEFHHLERSAIMLREDGFPVEFEASDPLGRGFYGALGIKEDCGVQPLLLVKNLLAASGATIIEGAEVFDVSRRAEGAIVRTPVVEVRSGVNVIALNAYAGSLDASWERIVTPHRGQVFVTEPLATRILDRLVYAHHGYIYFRQLPDRRLLLGGWRHQFAEMEAGSNDRVTTQVQDALEGFLRRYFPEAASARIEARWSGTMGFSPDGIPVADRSIEDDRIFYLLGFTGHGFGLALEVARRLARFMLTGESTGIFGARRLAGVQHP